VEIPVGPVEAIHEGSVKIVQSGSLFVGVYRIDGRLYAIEDRCSHDDGPLCEGEWDAAGCQVLCPRHGSRFDLRTGAALTLPAYLPVATYPVRVRDDGMIVIDVSNPTSA